MQHTAHDFREALDPHHACRQRETEAWKRALEEVARRKKADWRGSLWRSFAVSGWFVIGVYVTREALVWWSR